MSFDILKLTLTPTPSIYTYLVVYVGNVLAADPSEVALDGLVKQIGSKMKVRDLRVQ